VAVWLGGEEDDAALTAMLNAGSAAELVPLLTLITMLLSVPTAEVDGVPESVPVVAAKVAQAGLSVMLKLTDSPLGLLTVGVKEYAWPT
jgi:hypothetical protein